MGLRVIHAYATQEHYIDHLAPIWHVLSRRGTFYVTPRRTMFDAAERENIHAHGSTPYHTDLTVIVAGGMDLAALRNPVLIEHGAGQSYHDLAHVAWSGGTDRDKVRLFIVPNHDVAKRNLSRYPTTPNVIAAPRVEQLLLRAAVPGAGRDLVVFGRHWTSALLPELLSAWPHHFEAIRDYCRGSHGMAALHFHPRCADVGRTLAKEWDVEYIATWEEVVRRACLYVVDNSSTGFEFAAMPGYRPVVWLNAPHYRRDVEQGLRFWKHVDVGDQCDEPEDLHAAIDNALTWPTWRLEQQAEHIRAIFPYILGSSERAARAIEGIE